MIEYAWAPKLIIAREDLEVDSYSALAFLAKANGMPTLLTKPERDNNHRRRKSFEYPPKPKVIFVDVNDKAEERIESLL